MSLLIGDSAPDFYARSTIGNIRFHHWKKRKWCVLFSHPENFTHANATEQGYTEGLGQKFEELNTLIIGLSRDSVEEHQKRAEDTKDCLAYIPQYPIIADEKVEIAKLYGMNYPNSSTTTTHPVFIIDTANKIRAILMYPIRSGRSFNEILRMVKALQQTDRHKDTTLVR